MKELIEILERLEAAGDIVYTAGSSAEAVGIEDGELKMGVPSLHIHIHPRGSRTYEVIKSGVDGHVRVEQSEGKADGTA